MSHLQQLHAQMISELPVPADQLTSAPLLAGQHTPQDLDNYIETRTRTWQHARATGQAPAG